MKQATSNSILLTAFPFLVKKKKKPGLSRTQVHMVPAFSVFLGPLCLNEPVSGCCSQPHTCLYDLRVASCC